MTATVIPFPTGRPPAAPAPHHHCTPVRDVLDVRSGALIVAVTCGVCGRAMWEAGR